LTSFTRHNATIFQLSNGVRSNNPVVFTSILKAQSSCATLFSVPATGNRSIPGMRTPCLLVHDSGCRKWYREVTQNESAMKGPISQQSNQNHAVVNGDQAQLLYVDQPAPTPTLDTPEPTSASLSEEQSFSAFLNTQLKKKNPPTALWARIKHQIEEQEQS